MLLERQVQMHVAAALADISRLKSMRANQAETDQRLAQLVHQRRAAAHAVQAARRRQRTLHKAVSVVCASLPGLTGGPRGAHGALPTHLLP
jgi:hypothetical protein